SHWHRSGFHKVERLRFRTDLRFFDCDVVRPAAAESWITVNRVAHFEPGDVRTRLFHDACDVVSRNQRQMSAEFPRILPAERERIGWIHAAGDYAHQRFIIVWFWSRNLFNLEHI